MDMSADSQPGMKDKLAQLMSMFSGAASAPANSGAVSVTANADNGAKDTAGDSAPQDPNNPEGMAPQADSKGLLGALQNLMQFFSAKPASASNDDRYQKILTDAGIPAGDTGIGH